MIVIADSALGNMLSFESGIDRLILNVGSYEDPPEPFGSAAVIAVEARVDSAARIPVIPNRYVISAAVGKRFGLAMFRHFADSSSLLEPATNGTSTNHWNKIAGKGRRGVYEIVPTIPLEGLLARTNLPIWFLKTDTQGMDLDVIKSAGEELRRVHYTFSETYCNNYSAYLGARNNFEEHWVPYMTYMGFKPVSERPCDGVGPNEINVMWENNGIQRFNKPDPSQCRACYT